jgi:hypothetical protein
MPETSVKGKRRSWDVWDLKTVMDRVGGRAQSWDDVVEFLKSPAVEETGLNQTKAKALIRALRNLKKEDFPFITDYRDLWFKVTGQFDKQLPPPEEFRQPPTSVEQIEDVYLKGLDFPTENNTVIGTAETNHAPSRVIAILKMIDDVEYENMDSLLTQIETRIEQDITGEDARENELAEGEIADVPQHQGSMSVF